MNKESSTLLSDLFVQVKYTCIRITPFFVIYVNNNKKNAFSTESSKQEEELFEELNNPKDY